MQKNKGPANILRDLKFKIPVMTNISLNSDTCLNTTNRHVLQNNITAKTKVNNIFVP